MPAQNHTPLPEGIVFDLDGVLIDSEGLHIEAWQIYFGGLGVTLPGKFYGSFIGASDRSLVEHLLRRDVLSGNTRTHIAGKRAAYLDLLRRRGRFYAGALELLALLAPRSRVALATSASRAEVAVAEELGLSGFFQVTVTGEDVKHLKPHPEVYRKAAERLGLPPERCVAIEDSVPGVAAARAAGLVVIAVAHTMPASSLGAADLVLAAISEITQDPGLLRRTGEGRA